MLSLFTDAFHHHLAGRLNEAEQLYRQVLAADPHHADSLHRLGIIADQAGRYVAAAEMISQAIAIDPGVALYHSNLGSALYALRRLDEAVVSYRTALDLTPDCADMHYNLGNALMQQGRLEQAAVILRRAIELRPGFGGAHNNLGNVLKQQRRLDEAAVCYRTAIALNPDFAETYRNLAAVLADQGRPDEAIACHRRSVALRPDSADMHYDLANALAAHEPPDEAVACFRRVLALRPNFAQAWSALGETLRQLGRLDDAVACSRMAINLQPDDPEAHLALAVALLARGDMAEGWRELEWRCKTVKGITVHRHAALPQWRGEAAKARTLLVHAEGGFGDTIQFCRYATLAAARGLRVIMAVQRPLVRLLQHLPGVDRVIGDDEDSPPFDLYCPMLSMPFALRATNPAVPGPAAYLHADQAEAKAWHRRLGALPNQGPRIGLVWAGNPYRDVPRFAVLDRRRSLVTRQLAPLFAVPGLHFFSLQKDRPAAQADLPLTDFMAEMTDFADTAALIANLDLVISVDTAVAHLAAALGKPVWMLDRFAPCWRWLAGRRDSPWYPTLRLYRQPAPGDWASVLTEVAGDLHSLASVHQAANGRPA